MNKINCAVTEDLLPLYAEDMVSPESRKAVEDHLADCPCCRTKAAEMKKELLSISPKDSDKPLRQFRRQIVELCKLGAVAYLFLAAWLLNFARNQSPDLAAAAEGPAILSSWLLVGAMRLLLVCLVLLLYRLVRKGKAGKLSHYLNWLCLLLAAGLILVALVLGCQIAVYNMDEWRYMVTSGGLSG